MPSTEEARPKTIFSETEEAAAARAFTQLLDGWRTTLAANIALRNQNLDAHALNQAVQRLLNRILFLRIAEDRHTEAPGTLKSTTISGIFYQNLLHLFRAAGQKYNAGLFDFRKEEFSECITLDNEVVERVIAELYTPTSPFAFGEIPAELLGGAYEQLLGKTISLSAEGCVIIEEKPEVRKAGGVYYTPQYIVDYIIAAAVGGLLEGKKPEDVEKIKIVDPACGSGAFLLGAYRYLLQWYRDAYTWAGIPGKSGGSKPLTPDGQLTATERKRILATHIYGVDLDANAVEVARLSLLLKCMEGETTAKMSGSPALPALDDNIKAGNSLVDSDFCEALTDEADKANPFSWQQAFPEIMDAGGFDCVIGNPPYGAALSPQEQRYFLKKFPVGNTDTAALFMALAPRLLKSGGYVGFIIPKSFTYASNWAKTRAALLPDLCAIMDCSKVWRAVKLEMTIYMAQKDSGAKAFLSGVRDGEKIRETGGIDKALCADFGFIINGVSDKEMEVARRLFNSPKRLPDYLTNRRGAMLQKWVQDSGDLYVIGGKQVQRYGLVPDDFRKIGQENVPDAAAFIAENALLVQNIVAHIQNPYPRIQIAAAIATAGERSTSVILDTVNQLTNHSELSTDYFLGLLHSGILNWYVYKFIYANAVRTMHFDTSTTNKIPFPNLDLNNKNHRKGYEIIVEAVGKIRKLKADTKALPRAGRKAQTSEEIAHLQRETDAAVMALFGIHPEEMPFSS